MISKGTLHTLLNFCLIQLHLLEERKKKLRKELLDCKVQEEYLTDIVKHLQDEIALTGEKNE